MNAIELHESGQAAADARRFDEASQIFAAAAAMVEAQEGQHSADLANIVTDQAECAIALMAYEEAVALATRATALLSGFGDDLQTEIGTTLYSRALGLLGTAHRNLGRYEQARGPLSEAIETLERQFGPDSVLLANPLNDFGVLCKYAGWFEEGEPAYRRALSLLEAEFGVDALNTATIWHNLGGLEHARGDYVRGEPMGRKAYEIRKRHLGETHLSTLADDCAWAGLLDGLDRHEESEAIYRTALAIYERELGPDDFEVSTTLNNLGMARLAQGDREDAQRLLGRACGIKEKLFDKDNPEVLLSRANLEFAKKKAQRP